MSPQTAPAPTLKLVPITQIKPAPGNPRRQVGDVTELAASIKAHGVLEPLLGIDGNGEGVLLVAGQRRLAAAKKAGLTEVPVIMRTLDEAQRLEVQLIENLQREDLDPLDEAMAYKQLLDLGCSESKLAERIGRSQSHISKRLSLLKLPDFARKDLVGGALQLADAYELTKIAEHPDRVKHAIATRKQSGYFRDMKQVVDQELELQKRDEIAAATRARLQHDGVKLLKDVEYQHQTPAGAIRLGSGFQELDIPVAQHAKLPCHRATVITSSGHAMHLCVDPKSHLKGPDKKKLARNLPSNITVDRKKEKAKDEAQRQALEEASAARKKVLARALKSRVPKTAAAHILAQLVTDICQNGSGFDVPELACELLGLGAEPRNDKGRRVLHSGVTPERKLEAYIAKGGDHLWRAALAVSFALGEDQLGEGWGEKTLLERHMAYLKKLGHVATPAEQKVVKAAR